MTRSRRRVRANSRGPASGPSPDTANDTDERVIGTTEELVLLAERFAGVGFLAVDTEFMRERTYYSQLCLIQVSDGTTHAAIDPLAPGIDLAPFWQLLAKPEITKVFHAAQQDLEIMFHATDELPLPIFDTQVAGMVLGHGDQIGYDSIVKRILGVDIDKSSRFTDWSRRPLSKAQISYALDDVIYLSQLYPRLVEQLEESGRAHWLDEEYGRLTDPAIYRIDPHTAWKRVSKKPLRPAPQARLEHLAAWRESTAQKRNIPRGHLVRDETLISIATANPSTIEDFASIRSFPGGANGKLAPIIIRELKKVDADAQQQPKTEGAKEGKEPGAASGDAPGEKKERRRRAKPPVAILDLLRVLLKHVTDEHDIAPRLVATAKELEALAWDDDASIRAQSGWRHEIFGRSALRLKRGEIALSTDGDKVQLIEKGNRS